MIASHITKQQLEDAAYSVGVRVAIHSLSGSGLRHRVKLYPNVPPEAWQISQRPRHCPICGTLTTIRGSASDGSYVGACGDAASPQRWANGKRWKGERGDAPYQRTSASYYRSTDSRVHAVCWHGFRDFFRACFKHAPHARFTTSFATWNGSEDFELRYRDSGHRNIGSQMAPIAAAEACRCPESGSAR